MIHRMLTTTLCTVLWKGLSGSFTNHNNDQCSPLETRDRTRIQTLADHRISVVHTYADSICISLYLRDEASVSAAGVWNNARL